ncbi:Sec-independent protein translocase protein TatB [Tabrizicola sp. YIM 78059]|uniref:Sec-independent protein translocase protein TatB n=1 Tax=Tabrizicola sp. YIM 78059 TaxID=2529861 RepID=UPI0010AABAC5|nr:Sec-independent protein translocase protein TatB [Tabrizicola sp. YIM 78059]
MDFSWSELLVIGIVALIFIGPKDLPGMFQQFGRFMAKVRAMGREFSRAMEEAAKETGVKEVAADLKKVANPKSMGLDAVKSAADKFEKWDPLKPAAKPTATGTAPLTPPPMPAAAAPVASAAAAAAPGSATAALAETVAAKKAAAAEKAAAIRAAREAPVSAAAEPPTPKRGGRVRRKAESGTGEGA